MLLAAQSSSWDAHDTRLIVAALLGIAAGTLADSLKGPWTRR